VFVILVYDIGEKRVGKVLKRCRKYLHWVQNSVLEGELTEAQLEKLKIELAHIIRPAEDSVIIYRFRSMRYADREIMGLQKGGQDFIL
jgi:CRISPR-associated protein Cas2